MKMTSGTKNTICKCEDFGHITFKGSYGTFRADYADDEYIQELLDWVSPKLISNEDIQYTDEEKETMLRLPRKECKP